MPRYCLLQMAGIAALAASFHQATAQWVRTNGPLGGLVQYLTANDSAIVAASYRFGVFRSTDDGISWIGPDSMLADLRVSCLAAKGRILFAGNNDGLCRSTDDGKNWVRSDSGLRIGNRSIISLGVAGDAVFAGTVIRGVYRSVDNGLHWTPADSGLPGRETTAFAANGNMVFAATSIGGMYRSTDNGARWDSVNSGLEWRSFNCLTVHNGTLFAGAYEGGMYRSTDNGANWVKSNHGLMSMNIRGLATGSAAVFAATDSGLFVSTDHGVTWAGAGSGLAFPYIQSVCLRGSTVLAGTFGDGIYRSSDNGASWNPSNAGLVNTSVADIAVNNGVLFAGLFNGGVFASKDKGETWLSLSSGLRSTSEDVYSLDFCGDTMFAATYAGVYLSADGGASWKKTVTDFPVNERANSFAISNNYVFAGTDQKGIFLTTDYGGSWFAVNSGLGQYPSVNCLATGYGVILAGTADGVYRTINGGYTWDRATTGIKVKQVFALAVNDSVIYAGTDNGVLRSMNIGATWSIVNTGLPSGASTAMPDPRVISVAASGSNIFAGMYEDGIYCSSDNGQQWKPANSGLAVRIRPASCLAMDGTDLFAGIDNGVWRRPISDMIGVVPRTSTPQAPSLMRFGVRTSGGRVGELAVSVRLPEAGALRVAVYDISGRTVALLADGRFGNGMHCFRWKPCGFAGGCFVVKISDATGTFVRNIPLVR